MAAKIKEWKPFTPVLSQSYSFKLEKKSEWIKPLCSQMFLENLQFLTQWRKVSSWRPQHTQAADKQIFLWLSNTIVGIELLQANKIKNWIFMRDQVSKSKPRY